MGAGSICPREQTAQSYFLFRHAETVSIFENAFLILKFETITLRSLNANIVRVFQRPGE